MDPSFDDLLQNLYKVAQAHHQAGALYYASLEKNDTKSRDEAAAQYKISGEMYLTALTVCEQRLLNMERDVDMEAELRRIQTLIHSVSVVLKYL
jgi:hypothetical protein